MSWEFAFALLKRYYNFSHNEILSLTQDQFFCYIEQIQEVSVFLGESEKQKEKVYQLEDIIILIKELGHKIPSEVK